MDTYRLHLYSAEDPTPSQVDAATGLLRNYEKRLGPHAKVFICSIDEPYDGPILVLGSQGPAGIDHSRLQYTYSPKQLESRPNAQTVFDAALDNYFGRVVGLVSPAIVSTTMPKTAADFIKAHFDLTMPIAVDVETGGVLGEDVTPRTAPMLTISFAQGSYAVALMVKYQSDEGKQVEEIIDFLQMLLPLIEKPIFHNGKFDIAVIEANTGVRMPNWFDTMLAHHALYMAAREHGLKILCKRYFDADDWEAGIKTWIKGKSQDYRSIPLGSLLEYNAYDVLWTYRLWEKLQIEIDADDRAQTAFFLEMEMAKFLYDVEETGIPVSDTEVNLLLEEYDNFARFELANMRAIVGEGTFNPASPLQVRRYLCDNGFRVPSTNEESITELQSGLNPEVDADVYAFCTSLIKYRKAKKMSGTYVRAWSAASKIEGDSRVHPTYHVHGTVTGRLSSSNPNAQNVPRDAQIRRMVTVNERNQLV